MIFHKRYLIPVWSSRVVSAVITFIITIPMLSNNPPCSETSSEATFSLHFWHQSPDLYAHFGIVVFSRPRNPEKWFWFLTNLPTSIYLEYVVISCYCSGTGCITGWETLICLWFVSFGIVCFPPGKHHPHHHYHNPPHHNHYHPHHLHHPHHHLHQNLPLHHHHLHHVWAGNWSSSAPREVTTYHTGWWTLGWKICH